MCQVEILGKEKLINPSVHKEDYQAFGLIVGIFLNLEVAFHLLLPLYLYQSQLSMQSWDSQHQKRRLFEIISLKNQKHYIQFHRKMMHGLFVVWL